ncbi:hypothetical protein GOC57_11710 [Sinorhizobium meliloti]|nr:hypothetical protein [Sinorhizobium meliloti]MDW9859439.1 hypothetical protein [Sinorhizobium meliloti]MDW9964560.1 hypothetical protein [Sinorhizobium meliloti]MDX0336842.1 hypothetical protein [Sinorhizobium meliloti]
MKTNSKLSGYISARFSSEPLAEPVMAPRFCVFEQHKGSPNKAKVEVLARKSSAHNVARVANALGVQWRLIFDLEDGPFVMLEMVAAREVANELACQLRRKRFQRVQLTAEAIAERPRSL